jgi:hypothetical protein
MRAMALVVGLGLAWYGLTVAQDQLFPLQPDGCYTPIRLSTLWMALHGASSDPMWLRHVSGFEAWLLARPVNVVLPFVGGFLALIGSLGIVRDSLRQ